MRPIHILLTGGTIDKVYDKHTGLMSHTHQSSIESILRKVNCSVPYTVHKLFMKDSIDITNNDRDYIKEMCSRIESESIIVIHGTDSMVETSKTLSIIQNKTIICVGSFIPSNINDSDAEFNIGTAIAYSQTLKHGSYISMNGIAFPYDTVIKNHHTQKFESK